MTTSTSLRSCFNWNVAFGILCAVIASTQFAQGATLLTGIARMILLPGVMTEILFSGNAQSGFANPALNYSICIGAAWLFWTASAVVALWFFRRASSKNN